ncbi:MAG: MmcQ/YjbR family DNA-binding protein [Solirubrobacteraceae bacterium]
MPGWSDVVAAGRGLPEVEEGTWFRTLCLRVRKKSFCRVKEDGETLVVRVVDLEDEEALLRAEPASSSPRRTTTATPTSPCASLPSTRPSWPS